MALPRTIAHRSPSCNPRAGRGLAGLLTLGVMLCVPVNSLADIQGTGRRKPAESPPGESARDRVRRAIAIPSPKDRTVKVLRGIATDIVLEATTASRQAIEFRLGEAPLYGTLSPPRASPDSKDQAVVTYLAPLDGTATSDEFTFRVKHRDTATSGSAVVKIEIADQKPVLKMERELNFGDVLVGESAVRALEIRNIGTGPFVSEIELLPPWRLLDGTVTLTVEPGEQEVVRIGFSPAEPGEANHEIVFPDVEDGSVRLRAQAIAPYEVRPAWIRLEWQPEERLRRGRVDLINRTASPLPFTAESSPRLRLEPSHGEIAPREHVEITVTLPAADARELQAPLTVAANACRTEVPVTAEAAPAYLKLNEPTADRGADGVLNVAVAGPTVTVAVQNAGGTAAPLFLKPAPGFEIIGPPGGKELGPGETAAFGIRAPEVRGTPPEGEMVLELGDDRLPIKVRAQRPVRPAAAVPSDPLLPTAAPLTVPGETAEFEPADLDQEEIEARAMIDVLGVFPAGTQFNRSLPEVDAVRLKSMSPTSVTLAWKPVGPEYDYVLFRQEYRPLPGDMMPTRYWIPIEKLKFRKSASEVSVTLRGLRPGHRHSLRLAARAPDGELGRASPPFAAITPSRGGGMWWKILLGVGGAAGIGWLVWRWWRNRWVEDDDDDE